MARSSGSCIVRQGLVQWIRKLHCVIRRHQKFMMSMWRSRATCTLMSRPHAGHCTPRSARYPLQLSHGTQAERSDRPVLNTQQTTQQRVLGWCSSTLCCCFIVSMLAVRLAAAVSLSASQRCVLAFPLKDVFNSPQQQTHSVIEAQAYMVDS